MSHPPVETEGNSAGSFKANPALIPSEGLDYEDWLGLVQDTIHVLVTKRIVDAEGDRTPDKHEIYLAAMGQVEATAQREVEALFMRREVVAQQVLEKSYDFEGRSVVNRFMYRMNEVWTQDTEDPKTLCKRIHFDTGEYYDCESACDPPTVDGMFFIVFRESSDVVVFAQANCDDITIGKMISPCDAGLFNSMTENNIALDEGFQFHEGVAIRDTSEEALGPSM